MNHPSPTTALWAKRTSIVGAIGFALFWVAAPTSANENLPWMAALAVHGFSIVCLSFGLGTLALTLREDPRARTLIVGIVVTVAGLLTAFLLIPVGLAVTGLGLLIVRGSRVAVALLLAGSAGLVTALATGARVGMEDAPPMSSGEIVWFQVSLALAAAGLVALGLRGATHEAVDAPVTS